MDRGLEFRRWEYVPGRRSSVTLTPSRVGGRELFRDEETGEYVPEKARKMKIFDKEVWVEEPALRQFPVLVDDDDSCS
jgi:hypothetical protein